MLRSEVPVKTQKDWIQRTSGLVKNWRIEEECCTCNIEKGNEDYSYKRRNKEFGFQVCYMRATRHRAQADINQSHRTDHLTPIEQRDSIVMAIPIIKPIAN